MSKYETVIGLEIHAQLRTESKMFCPCNNNSVDAEPNTNICPVCLGMPGMLPVANKKAIEWTYLLGMALGSKIPEKFNFERKNYFYPDLPKAYQITSATNPPVVGGTLEVDNEGVVTNVHIHHIHLEEDAGKLVHPDNVDYSLVDLNRAGTPLMEIVTEPDMHSAREARIFVQNLRAILRYLGISDANMEQGNLRCDANISLRPVGQKELGTKVEVKNINSFKMIEKAIEYEVERQAELLDDGEVIVQETRGWNDAKGITTGQRSKEEANDYRYFPEPDLPPIDLSKTKAISLDDIKTWLPELPKEKCSRFVTEYGLSKEDAAQLTSDLDLARYYEQALETIPEFAEDGEIAKKKAKRLSNWLLSELIAALNNAGISIIESNVKPASLAALVQLIDAGDISGKIAKEVFAEMFISGKEPAVVVSEKGLTQISDTGAIEAVVDEVIGANSKSVEDYKGGQERALGFLVGQVMVKTKGQANPKIVNEILSNKLKR